MEIPELLEAHVGDEEITTAVELGSDDIVCFTPTRTLLYDGEGLLSDESVTVYDHDIERLDLTTGRRKATFELAYVDRTDSFSVSSSKVKPVLTPLLAGVLGAWGVTEPGETVVEAFRFSELTVVITDERLTKHVGASVWGEDYEQFPYAAVTGLEFEEGQVATQIVLSSDGRPHRIKVPSDDVAVLRNALTTTLCTYHDVDSIEALNARTTRTKSDDAAGTDRQQDENRATGDSFEFDEGITPLVGDSETDPDSGATGLSDDTESTTRPPAEPTEEHDGHRAEADREDGSGITDPTASHEPPETTADTGGTEPSNNAPESSKAVNSTAETDTGTDAADTGTTPNADQHTDANANANTQADPGGESDTDEDERTATDAKAQAADTTSSGDKTEANTGDPLADAVEAHSPVAGSTAAAGEPDRQAVRETVEELAETVERQSELLERQQRTIERLIERLD